MQERTGRNLINNIVSPGTCLVGNINLSGSLVYRSRNGCIKIDQQGATAPNVSARAADARSDSAPPLRCARLEKLPYIANFLIVHVVQNDPRSISQFVIGCVIRRVGDLFGK